MDLFVLWWHEPKKTIGSVYNKMTASNDTTDDLQAQFKSSIKWANCIRQHFPTMIFYFSQTYDQTIVIYYCAPDGTISMVHTKLSVDAIKDASDLPSMLVPYFALKCTGGDKETYKIPGIQTSTPWTLTGDGKLTHDHRVLVSTTGVVDIDSRQLTCIYAVYINKTARKLEWSRHECTEDVKTCISNLNTGLWTTFKSVLGVSK